jgi:hypothetical protein
MKMLTKTIWVLLATSAAFAVLGEEKVKIQEKPMLTLCIDARQLKGEVGMTLEKDPDNFQYAHSKDAGGIGFTVTPQQAGEWYVFVRVRVGATAPFDWEAALISLTGGAETNAETLATARVSGSPGDDSWQTVGLGKCRLVPGMRIAVMPGTKNPLRFLDVRNALFMAPALFESSVSTN